MNKLRNINILFLAIFMAFSTAVFAQDPPEEPTPGGDTPTEEPAPEPVPDPAPEPEPTDPTTTPTSTPYTAPPSATMPGGDAISALSNAGAQTEVMKLPWSQEIAGLRTPMAYAFIRESDVFWWKNVWRVIDCREKINLHFKWPKNPLIDILLESIKSGKVAVYSGMDDDFTTPVDPQDALNVAGGGTDSIYVMNPETGLDELQVITKEVNWNNVNKFRIKEVWYFDKQHSTMQVRIMGICPLFDNYTTDPMTGEDIYRGEVPIFWVYFPGMREIMVNNEAYNPFPNGVRLNWDQVFALRLFSSYIYKVDNVQDYRIKDYKSGIDILYESEAKKQELFNFEHDLWEF